MKNQFLLAMAFIFSFVLAQSAFAHGMQCGDRMQEMVKSLHLDDAQKAQVKPIMDKMTDGMKSNWMQMKDIRAQINQQVDSDAMDQAVVDGLIDKQVKMMGDMMKAKAMTRHQIAMILNAKQKTSYQDMMKKMHEKMEAMYAQCHKGM